MHVTTKTRAAQRKISGEKVWQEKIDGAVVLFLRNGFAEAKEILLTLPTMENLSPSKTVPLSMVVEPQTERFAVILKQRDFTVPFRYQTEWKYRSAK